MPYASSHWSSPIHLQCRKSRELDLIPGLGWFPGVGNTTLVLLAEKSHGQRSLAGYSPWGHKESDATECALEWLQTAFNLKGKATHSLMVSSATLDSSSQITWSEQPILPLINFTGISNFMDSVQPRLFLFLLSPSFCPLRILIITWSSLFFYPLSTLRIVSSPSFAYR